MKKITVLICLIATAFLGGCKKTGNAKISFYVSNAGDAGKWDHITVKMANQTDYFFTPERSNMKLSSCESAEANANMSVPNAIIFSLPGGTYQYTANNGKWSGSITVSDGDCRIVELQY